MTKPISFLSNYVTNFATQENPICKQNVNDDKTILTNDKTYVIFCPQHKMIGVMICRKAKVHSFSLRVGKGILKH